MILDFFTFRQPRQGTFALCRRRWQRRQRGPARPEVFVAGITIPPDRFIHRPSQADRNPPARSTVAADQTSSFAPSYPGHFPACFAKKPKTRFLSALRNSSISQRAPLRATKSSPSFRPRPRTFTGDILRPSLLRAPKSRSVFAHRSSPFARLPNFHFSFFILQSPPLVSAVPPGGLRPPLAGTRRVDPAAIPHL
jgi:hypothetical protein